MAFPPTATTLLLARLRSVILEALPAPGCGHTAARHLRLFEIGREDLSLARLAEAHFDAIAILAEAGRTPTTDALYGVWAAELPGQTIFLTDNTVTGTKPFCSGAGIVDRALVTVGDHLIDIDLKSDPDTVTFDDSHWHTTAFAETHTSSTTFTAAPIDSDNILGPPRWYLDRAGFWHGACGPAACWAGGAAGLVDFALTAKRADPHTLAHLGGMHADLYALRSILITAGDEIDAAPADAGAARIRARTVRHLVEQSCTDILRRLARAFGPHPLAMEAAISRRYQELDLYLRQCHSERDLEALGHDLRL